MSRPLRALVWLLSVAALSATLWFSAAWLQLPSLPRLAAQNQPDIALKGSVLTHYDEAGKRLWTVEANSIMLDQRRHTTVALTSVVRFFGQGDGAALAVHAERMVLDNASGDVRFEGTLSAQDAQGLQFDTSDARWDNKERVLEGEGALEVQQNELSFEGRGFRYDVQAKKLLIKEQAHLRWVLPQGTP